MNERIVVRTPLIGVLALQGAFAAHESVLRNLGAVTRRVRTPDDLDGLDGLVLPGGESTTMSNLLESSDLFEPISRLIGEGLPVFGTCAGLILLATKILDGRGDQRCFAAIDVTVRRNAYGRQIDSFETELLVDGVDHPVPAMFIRAPVIESIGSDVQVLALDRGAACLVRQGNVLAASFHPELTSDAAVHEMFVDMVRELGLRAERDEAPEGNSVATRES
jgi:5'-phosphate synthase pdxT subunit